MSSRPLSAAVSKLLKQSLRTPQEIAKMLGVEEDLVSSWFKGFEFPSDREMSMILRDFELTSGSGQNPHLPGVLSQFWNELRVIEESLGAFYELPCEPCQTVAARLTQFTQNRWIENLETNIHMIHPSRRCAFFENVMKVFNQFTDD